MTDIIYPVPSEGDLKCVEKIEVIHIERGIGGGIKTDPYRIIHEYFSMEGELLARRDPEDGSTD